MRDALHQANLAFMEFRIALSQKWDTSVCLEPNGARCLYNGVTYPYTDEEHNTYRTLMERIEEGEAFFAE